MTTILLLLTEDSIAIWRKLNACPDEPTITEFSD